MAYGPRLHALAADKVRIAALKGGERLSSGAIAGFWVEYPDLVPEFFGCAAREPWCDYNYDPILTGAMIREPGRIGRASLNEVRTMLTWCVRGERFCDGHWWAVLEDGTIFHLLDRLAEQLQAERQA